MTIFEVSNLCTALVYFSLGIFIATIIISIFYDLR